MKKKMRKHTRERVAVMILFHLLTLSLFKSGQASSEHVDPVTIDMTLNNQLIEEKVRLNKDNTSSNLTDTLLRKPRGPRGCGMASKSRTRVVGGQPADPKEWPWMAALLKKGSRQYCAGVLITDRHILTAAHCLYGVTARDLIVRLGEYDFSKHTERRALDFKVVELRVHEKFNPSSYDNDIAILKIHRPTIFNNYIWPICLPPEGKTFENKNAIVTGWGSLYYAGPTSSILMEVSIPVWSHNRCVRTLGRKLPESILCAGAYEGGRDSCQGDSGGPLVYQLGNGRWVNIGIVSWGMRCGDPGQPGIYTRVSTFLDWIFSNAVF